MLFFLFLIINNNKFISIIFLNVKLIKSNYVIDYENIIMINY